jgi:WhiB family redox-sensing transcriptional regulator
MKSSLEWMDDALCREVGQDLFFPEMGSTPNRAKEICRRCEVQIECLTYALTVPGGVDGVWGGTTAKERRAIKRVA